MRQWGESHYPFIHVCVRVTARSRAIDMGQTSYHVNDNLISIGVWHQPCQRTMTCHSKSARVVDDDEIHASLFDRFRRKPDSYSLSAGSAVNV